MHAAGPLPDDLLVLAEALVEEVDLQREGVLALVAVEVLEVDVVLDGLRRASAGG